MVDRLESIPWGSEKMKNLKGYLRCYSNRQDWHVKKAGLIGRGLLRQLPIHEKAIVTLFLLAGYRDASIESLGPDDIFASFCPFTREPCIKLMAHKAKTWPAFKTTSGFERSGGIISIVCNCSIEDGNEFCLLCNDKWKAIAQTMPLPRGTLQRILNKIEKNPHSLRRTLACMVAIANQIRSLSIARWCAHFFWKEGSPQRMEYASEFKDLMNLQTKTQEYNFIPSRGVTFPMNPGNDVVPGMETKNETRMGKLETAVEKLEKKEAAVSPEASPAEIAKLDPADRAKLDSMKNDVRELMQELKEMKTSVTLMAELKDVSYGEVERRIMEPVHEPRKHHDAIMAGAGAVFFPDTITTSEQVDEAFKKPSLKLIKETMSVFF